MLGSCWKNVRLSLCDDRLVATAMTISVDDRLRLPTDPLIAFAKKLAPKEFV